MMTTTWGGPPAERRFPLVKVSDVAIVDGEVEYLIDELLPRTGLAEIWGPPRCGKSFWMSEWLKTFEQMDTKERKPDTRRTAVERACRKLQKARMIGFWKPYVWLLTPPGHSGHSGHS